ncbi:MAG: hypothetical protein COA79_19875 [Planctomycetota bacterium]|nr:MAG: hypothetical protein COA79_19875 [Planctomycetota bacterium]
MNNQNIKYFILITFAFLLPLLFLLFYKSFSGPFYLDSLLHLSVNQSDFLTELFKDSDQTISKIGTRLFITITFVINEWIGGHSPKSFRIGNILIHWLASIALYHFLKQLYLHFKNKDQLQDSSYQLKIIFITLLWSLHPISTTAVSYVIQRAASLSTLFLFITFALYLRTRRLALEKIQQNEQPPLFWSIKWSVLMLVSFLLAVASKETAILGLPMIITMELFLQKGLKNFFKNRLILFLTISTSIPAFFALYGHRHEIGMIYSNYQSLSTYAQFTWYERLLTEGRVLLEYLYKLIFPWHTQFNLQKAVNPSKGLFTPITTLLSFLFIFGILLFAWKQRAKRALLSISIFCFFISQLIESTILPLHIYFEHRVYFPSIFLWIGISEFIKINPLSKKASIALVATLMFLCTQTFLRNSIYGDPIKLYENDIAVSKTNLALCNLGNEYLTIKDYQNSLKYFSQAIEISPKHYGGYAGAGSSYYHLNKPKKAELFLTKSLHLGGGNKNLKIYFELGMSKLNISENNERQIKEAWTDLLLYANLNKSNQYQNYLWVISALVRHSKMFTNKSGYKKAQRNIQECLKHTEDYTEMKILNFIFSTYQSNKSNLNYLQRLSKLQVYLLKNNPNHPITNYLKHFDINTQNNSLGFSPQLNSLFKNLSIDPRVRGNIQIQKADIYKFLTKYIFKSKIPKTEKLRIYYSIIEISILTSQLADLDQISKNGLGVFSGRLIDTSFINSRTDKYQDPYFHMILSLAPQIQKIILEKD